MHKWQKFPQGTRNIGVLLFEQFSNHCLANAIEPLRAVNTLLGREAYRWRFMTLDGAPVTSSSGLPVGAQGSLADCAGDVLFVVSSYGYRDCSTPAMARALRAAARRYSVVVGMDTGCWLMAAAGLLDGCRATIHWDELESFGEAFPEIAVERRRVVMDGVRWSCGGAMTAFDLVQRMIGKDHGEALRLEVAAMFMAGEGEPAAEVEPRGPSARLVSTTLAAMRMNLEDPLTVPELAANAGVGRRRLESQFRKDLGAGPRQVYRRIRLTAARRLVEQTQHSVAEIALRCGYQNASAMTRAFGKEFGMSPRRMRVCARETFPD